MLLGQQLVVYTDHQYLMRDALGLTSDRVHQWILTLKEYGPEIVYMKGIDNTMADAISRLDFTPPLPCTKGRLDDIHKTLVCTQEGHTNTQHRATFGIHEPCVC